MPSRGKPKLVVLGMMGWMPVAGVTWQALHYLEGFRRLGYDVYYVEDNGAWPYDPEQNTVTDDPSYTVRYLQRMAEWWGYPDRWAYVATAQDRRVYGLSPTCLASLWDEAQVLVNLTGCTVLRPEHMQVPVRIFLETDPVLPQIEVAQGKTSTIEMLEAHTHLFTFGENVGAGDCTMPLGLFRYHPTRQPVILDWWFGSASLSPEARFSTISNWELTVKDVEWEGECYLWSKHRQFMKYLDMPRRVGERFDIALAVTGGLDSDVVRLLTDNSWSVSDALTMGGDIEPYRVFILGSKAEFTVAKEQYVRMNTGWFSDRSACYLAAGKPVVTQRTGFEAFLPAGEGLFAFSTPDEASDAVSRISSDYQRHSAAARAIAQEHFAAEGVLGDMLRRVGLDVGSDPRRGHGNPGVVWSGKD